MSEGNGSQPDNGSHRIEFVFEDGVNVARFGFHVGSDLSPAQLIIAAHLLERTASQSMDATERMIAAAQGAPGKRPIEIVRSMDAAGSLAREMDGRN